ncbi:MAG: hypothetical protein ABS81_22045 [Pseudonocardia sp. SCN 72-86]|nr:MAG: hypothetical protein ABS81_22045 [Pseudonocardia sp. SCN 72-86]
MPDAANLADWVSASADVIAAVGTVGAFATGFALIRRDRDAVRAEGVAGVRAIWRRTGDHVDAETITPRLREIYRPEGAPW